MNYTRTVKAGLLAFGQGARSLAMLIIAALLSRWLTIEDYATYRQALLCVTIISPVLMLGLPDSLLYFISKSPNESRKTLTQVLLLTAITSFIFAAFIYCGGAELLALKFNNPKLEVALLWLGAYPLLMVPATLAQPCLVAVNKVVWATLFTTISRIILMLLVIVPLWFVRDPILAVQATLLAAVIVYVPGLLLMYKQANKGGFKVTKQGIKKQLYFAVPLGLGAIIGSLNQQLGSMLVASQVNPEEFAIFINGAFEVPFIAIITGSASAILLPDIAKLYEAQKYKEAISLFHRSAIKAGMILIPLTGLLAVLAPEVMQILFGDKFTKSATFFRIYLILLPLRVVLFMVLFQAAGKSKLIFIRSIICLVANIVLTWFFLRLWGSIGAAIAMVATTILVAYPYCLYCCSKLYKCKIRSLLPYKELGKWVLMAMLAFGIASAVKIYLQETQVIIKCIWIGSVYLLLLGFLSIRFKLIK